MEPVNNYPDYIIARTNDRRDAIAIRTDEIGSIKKDNNNSLMTIKNKYGLDLGCIQNMKDLTVKEVAEKIGTVIDLTA